MKIEIPAELEEMYQLNALYEGKLITDEEYSIKANDIAERVREKGRKLGLNK